MKWTVEIQRTALTNRNLGDLLLGLRFSLIDGIRHPEIWSQQMDQCTTAAEAFEIAKRVQEAFTGAAQIDADFTLGAVLDHTTTPPTRHVFLEVQSCATATSFGIATLTVGPPPGLSAEEIEAWQKNRAEREYEAQLDAQRSRLEPAYLEQRATKVLEHLAVTSPSAEVLYKIYELMEEHPRNRQAFHRQFGISETEFNRFGDAVHNPTVSGDWARHAYLRTPRTSNPMSKCEAECFVRAIAEKWLRQFRATAPP